MQTISTISRLPTIKESIFPQISFQAKQFNALNLSQGYPDFAPDERLYDALSKAIRDNCNQYCLPEGVEQLRVAIANMFQDLYAVELNPTSEITITTGATQAIFSAISALIHAGDEVIYIEPAFECYAPAIILAGGIPVPVELNSNFNFDWEKIEGKVTKNTRMIIVNNPHNPTGSCWTQDDITHLAEIAEKYDLLVLSDEVYHNVAFDSDGHITALSNSVLRNRTIVVGSLSKTMNVTGWRIGYALAPKSLAAEIRKILQFNTYSAPTPLQHAVGEILQDSATYRSPASIFMKKRDLFLKELSQSRFKFVPAKGTYFQLLDYSEISNDVDTDFAYRLVSQHGIAAIPLSAFSQRLANRHLLRFCFAKKDETLLAAGLALSKL